MRSCKCKFKFCLHLEFILTKIKTLLLPSQHRGSGLTFTLRYMSLILKIVGLI